MKDGLNHVNKLVYRKFKKANKSQKAKMIQILTQQLDNLKLLLKIMKENVNR